ncbi:MAG: type II secretion system protein [Myxococcota bacterium]
MRRSGRRVEGLTLVEAAVLISLTGIALAVFVPTFFRQLRTSKIDEASEHLEQLAGALDAYYVERRPEGRGCLPAGAGPTLDQPGPDPQPVDYDEVEGAATWSALSFRPERPLRYSYEVIVRRAGCDVRVPPGEALYTVRATGDLDGDGRRSTFERSATLNEEGDVIPLGVLYVTDRVE